MTTQQIQSGTRQRLRLRVTGVVQGVGFRPFVYGLAQTYNLGGFAGNDSNGVFIEIEGTPDALQTFQQQLAASPPPLARIEQVQSAPCTVLDETTFRIVKSQVQANTSTLISPDLTVCEDCLDELFDPANRRYRYPFINCTNCGPRFTIIQDIPYDRPLTTMHAFEMCDNCAAEYHNPADRRFHAQPNACPECGPRVTFQTGQTVQRAVTGEDAIQQAKNALLAGQIVAVKGLGGFHLACDATNEQAVARLRERKQRPHKPFALMVADVAVAHEIVCFQNDAEHDLLLSRERPIVLLKKHDITKLASAIAPGHSHLGIMLPYTPLHYLLLDDMPPLVMTSGNLSNEPIVITNQDALQRLSTLADAFLLHNRDIHVPCDDSVAQILPADNQAGASQSTAIEQPLRRSRGYAPFPLTLAQNMPSLLAVGADLKNTFCLTHENHAFVSQHIGDMENLETLHAFEKSVQHMQTLFRIQPEAVVCDRHPGYLSSRAAEAYASENNLSLVKAQHHHAHIASVMAEHHLNEPVIGFSFDGTGYGDDGAIWGGEVFIADATDYQRVAHLAYAPLAGGDAAVKRPYRLALAHLWQAGIQWDDDLPPVQQIRSQEQSILQQQLEKSLNTVPTSSMGRLFDAVASLIGLRHVVSYEAQAAMELEAIAQMPHDTSTAYRFDIHAEVQDRPLQIDPAPVLRAIIADMRDGVTANVIAGRFHEAVAQMVLDVAQQVQQTTGLQTVVLSGGVFQNMKLLSATRHKLQEARLAVYIPQKLPANDGGIAPGQALIAAARLAQK